jgi:hypothetical protein
MKSRRDMAASLSRVFAVLALKSEEKKEFSLISHNGALWMNRDLNDLFDRPSEAQA